MRSIGRRALGLVVLSLSVLSCGGTDQALTTDSRPLYDRLATLLSGASFTPPIYRSATEASPATTYVVDGQETVTASDVLVIGAVQSVEGVAAWSYAAGPSEEGEPDRVERLALNDPQANIDVVSVTVRVE